MNDLLLKYLDIDIASDSPEWLLWRKVMRVGLGIMIVLFTVYVYVQTHTIEAEIHFHLYDKE